MRILIFILLIVSNDIVAQQGYKSKHKNKEFKGWDSSAEFNKLDVQAVDYNKLKENFLNKKVKPIYISKEFREYKYKNFYHDKKLKREFRKNKRKGFKSHVSNGAGGTLVYYRANTNYEFLFDKIFIVQAIYPVTKIRHVASTDDTNYVFQLYSKEIGRIYYEYNSKFKDGVEIELVN